jgi:hypothetical protein
LVFLVLAIHRLQLLAAREEVFRLQIAALMPGLSAGQIKNLKR